MAEPVRNTISQSVVARVARSLGAAFSAGKDAWFGPLDPLPAQVPAVEGRQWDFPAGYNLGITPREGEPIGFGTMRALADGYDLLRLVIETRKDQLAKYKWGIKPREKDKEPDDRCKQLDEFFLSPDKEHDWEEWLRAVVEDMLVIDAATIYPRRTKGGEIYAFELMDGATIKRVLSNDGRTPLPPDPAYQQILKGIPAVNYTAEELLYRPRNVRTWKVYGYSPVEQVISTVNIALRRQVSQLSYYTEGSTPDLILSVPKEWNPDQIRQFKLWWDSLLAGNVQARRGTMFVPEGVNPINTKEEVLKDEYDEWLARIICYAFSVSPQALLMMMNRATAEVASDEALSQGLHPLLQWVKRMLDRCIWFYFGFRDLEFQWDMEEKVSPAEQATIDKTYIDAKVMTPDEVRASKNLDPLTPEQRETYWPAPVAPGEEDGKPGEGDGKKPPVKKAAYGGLEKKKRSLAA